MSDIGLIFGPWDYVGLALLIGSPGLIIGAGLGVFAWRRRRITGAIMGGVIGMLFCIAGVVLKIMWF
jgi:ABC-type antimicrobial peptide transport system permease subunit